MASSNATSGSTFNDFKVKLFNFQVWVQLSSFKFNIKLPMTSKLFIVIV